MTGIANLRDYYAAVAAKAIAIHKDSLADLEKVGRAHSSIELFGHWYDVIRNYPESICLCHAVQELQVSLYATVNGLYRPSFTALRLALELSLATVYFSAHRLNLEEWKNGRWDLHWATITGEDGVFSTRYLNAFFPALTGAADVHKLSTAVYRRLSEFVHGNVQTLLPAPELLKFNHELHNLYFEMSEHVAYGCNYALCLRYLRELSSGQRSEIEHYVLDSLGHIPEIRDIFQVA